MLRGKLGNMDNPKHIFYWVRKTLTVIYYIHNTYTVYAYCLSIYYVIFVCIEDFVPAFGTKSRYFLLSSIVISNLGSCTDNPRTDNREYITELHYVRISFVHSSAGYKVLSYWTVHYYCTIVPQTKVCAWRHFTIKLQSVCSTLIHNRSVLNYGVPTTELGSFRMCYSNVMYMNLRVLQALYSVLWSSGKPRL